LVVGSVEGSTVVGEGKDMESSRGMWRSKPIRS